jgi:hypothetical protein
MNKGTNLPPKITNDLDIIIPPNFEMFAKEDTQSEQVQLNLPPRLGENNPLALPCLPSSTINFEHSNMVKLNLDTLLNPHQNDLEFMEKELNLYRQQVQVQTEEFKQLEKEKNELKNNSGIADVTNSNIKGSLEYVRQQNLIKQKELEQIKSEKAKIMNAIQQRNPVGNSQSFYNGNQMFNQAPAPVAVYSMPMQSQQPFDNFFDQKEVIRVNDNDMSGYHFYDDDVKPQQQTHQVYSQPTSGYNLNQGGAQAYQQPRPMAPAQQVNYSQPPQQIGFAQNPQTYNGQWNQHQGSNYR